MWYKDAIVYQLHVKVFRDSGGDGIGDFPGLTQKLDYIRDLGATAIWLLPFYPSPLRDDGYDISDYKGIHPLYGTMRDFRIFMREAHARGLRVITELVINHTSDQHPWFQRARHAKPGSRERNFYVWSDTPRKYADARIIFTDTESSNWAWDPVAGAYYWHRFFSHQPELNFDNPHVLRAILGVMRFWLKMGVDGMRLDAIPYLCEREGTNCENLPETHEVIRNLRAVLEREFPGRIFLAEANQWPEDVRAYFGDGDECHMAFHFPLMPRMFMAIAEEDRYPILDIMQQTPEIPPTCQWAIFLRNHDEMTLEMVTERERDYMYRTYATEPQARINIGIRRRLAPLMGNDRRKIELMTALLLSMPGTPIIYYGDEIGMGDNIFLRDRDGVRTPMQWSIDRNAGFSMADPARLYHQPIMDPLYGYQAVNVESQELNPFSLLNTMRRLIAVRRSHSVFGRGTLEFLRPANRKILAFLRENEEQVVLCVANLSRTPQAVALDLARFAGRIPVEMIGWSPFPRIREERYLLTLPGHAFFWFVLLPAADVLDVETEPPNALPELPTLVVTGREGSALLSERNRCILEREVLPAYLGMQGVEVDAAIVLRFGFFLTCRSPRLCLAVSGIEQGAAELAPSAPRSALTRARWRAREGLLCEGLISEPFILAIVEMMRDRRRVEDGRLSLTGTSGDALREMALGAGTLRRIAESKDPSCVVLDDCVFFRMLRSMESEPEPRVESMLALQRMGYAGAPPLLGTLEIRDGDEMAICTAHAFVESSGNGWSATLAYLERTLPGEEHTLFMERVRLYGVRLAQLHRALAAITDDPAFAPEPMSGEEWSGQCGEVRKLLDEALLVLREANARLPEEVTDLVARLSERRSELLERIAAVERLAPPRLGNKQRIHGGLHLGSYLLLADDALFTDIGGDISLPRAERRRKNTPLRDLASLLHSIHYAAVAASHGVTHERAGNLEASAVAARKWRVQACAALVRGYALENAGSEGLAQEAEAMLDLLVLHEALREIPHELDHRPEWLRIPLETCLELLDEEG